MRAVAPPYPGALTSVSGRPARVLRTRVLDDATPAGAPVLSVRADGAGTTAESLVAICGGGGTLRIDALEIDGEPHSAAALRARFGDTPLPLG